MVLDRQKVRTDGRSQNYIPLTSSGDNKLEELKRSPDLLNNVK